MRELTLPARLILLPGLGAGPSILTPQREAFGDALITPAPIENQGHETIGSYAKRWAELINRTLDPSDDRPLFLGGLSFGGMVAQEMAMHLSPRPRAVLLIGSTRRGDTVSLPGQLMQKAIAILPGSTLRKFSKPVSLGFGLVDGLDDMQKKIMVDAMADADPAFLKWGAKESVDWPGFSPPDGYPPIHQINGDKDWIFAPPPADQATLVEDGRHLINLTHELSVNRFLFDCIMQLTPEAQAETPHIEDPHTTAQRRLNLEGAPAGTPLV